MAFTHQGAALTAQEAARRLDQSQYGDEGSKELFSAMKDAGLVAIFGASDDLMEIRGAVYDERGFEAWFTPDGLLENDCENEDCPAYGRAKAAAGKVRALWGAEPPFSFTYETDIPHETFVVLEDADPYCRGIVFALADLEPKLAAPADESRRSLAIRLWSALEPRGSEEAWVALPPEVRDRWLMIAGFAATNVKGPSLQQADRDKPWDELTPDGRARWLRFAGLNIAAEET